MTVVARTRDWLVREHNTPHSFANTVAINAAITVLSKVISMSVFTCKKDFHGEDPEAHQKFYREIHEEIVGAIQKIVAKHVEAEGSMTIIAGGRSNDNSKKG